MKATKLAERIEARTTNAEALDVWKQFAADMTAGGTGAAKRAHFADALKKASIAESECALVEAWTPKP